MFLKTLILFANSFDTHWAHYSVHLDPHFINRLQSLGYNLVLSDKAQKERSDWTLFGEASSIGLDKFPVGIINKIKCFLKQIVRPCDISKQKLYEELQINGPNKKIALTLFEGLIGMPQNYSSKLHAMFPIVFTWNDTLVDGKHFFKFKWPLSVDWPPIETIPFSDRKLLVNISANKYNRHKLELYSERRAAIKYFEKTLPDNFALYGIGWNSPATRRQRLLKFTTPHYHSYRGVVDSKTSVLPKHRFALCYENACDPGWITEKIFDCLRCGCVPVYLGAPNIADYVDSKAFVDRRKFKSNKALADYLSSVTEKEYQQYQTAISEYLASPLFASFLSPAFADTIISVLDSHSEIQL
jgi:alpha(1,3/1,4) fucosyltransferase